jgi:hypothetical protein
MYEYLTNVNCKYVYNYTGEKLNLILFKFSLLVDYEDILSTVLEWLNPFFKTVKDCICHLKGQCHQIFHLWFFSSNNFSWPQ